MCFHLPSTFGIVEQYDLVVLIIVLETCICDVFLQDQS